MAESLRVFEIGLCLIVLLKFVSLCAMLLHVGSFVARI